MKSIYEHATSFQARAKTRKELIYEQQMRRLERDLKRAEKKDAETAARAKRKHDRFLAKRAKRIEAREKRQAREATMVERAVAKATPAVKREVKAALKAIPTPRKPSLKRLNRLALERRIAKERAERKPRELPPLPYSVRPKLPPLPYA